MIAVARAEPVSPARSQALRYAVCAYFGVASVQWTVAWAVFIPGTVAFGLRVVGGAGHLTSGFLLEAVIVPIAIDALWTLAVVAFMLLLAVGALWKWRRAFWATLAWLALSGAVGIVASALRLIAIGHVGVSRFIVAAAIQAFDLVWALVGLALAIWCVIAATRRESWG